MQTEFPMHLGGGRIIQLDDVLANLPENNWIWGILYFDGTGTFPNEMTWQEFEKSCRAPKGRIMHWPELKAFAAKLYQTYDCLIIAVKSENDIDPAAFKSDIFDKCLIAIEAHDSGSWKIVFNQALPNKISLEQLQQNIIDAAKLPPKEATIVRGASEELK